MSDVRRCDMCLKTIRDDEVIAYRVERTDLYGPLDSADICSPECLATLSVGDSHLRGEAAQRDVHARQTRPQPKRWWWR